MSYKSTHTGQQIDAGVDAALNPDTTPTAGSDALMTSGGTKSAINSVQDDVAIRVVGNKTSYASGAAIGQYIIVSDSTITGITDGMYKAAKAIPYNTVIDSTYLTAVSDGAANDLRSAINAQTIAASFNTNSYYTEVVAPMVYRAGQVVTVNLEATCSSPYSASPGYAVVNSLPKPLDQQYFAFIPGYGASGGSLVVSIDTYGNLYFRYGEANKTYDVSLTYITNE